MDLGYRIEKMCKEIYKDNKKCRLISNSTEYYIDIFENGQIFEIEIIIMGVNGIEKIFTFYMDENDLLSDCMGELHHDVLNMNSKGWAEPIEHIVFDNLLLSELSDTIISYSKKHN